MPIRAIASPTVYAATIQDGQNGFLAREDADWSRLLIALGQDPALRHQVAATAWGQVRAGRMMAGQVATRMALRAPSFAGPSAGGAPTSRADRPAIHTGGGLTRQSCP